MPVTVLKSFDLRDLKFSNREMMREIGLLARELIVRRTIAGQGVDGPFQPYSAKYAERKGKELGKASPVDLTVSGGMLRNLQIIDVTDTTVTLGWTT